MNLKSIKFPGLEDIYYIPQTYSDVGAAPDGYGLGKTTPESITSTEQLDATRKTGFYRYAITGSNICGISFSYGALTVYSITANSCVQEIRPYTTNYCLRRNYVNGTWSAWVNADSTDFAPSGYGLGATTPTAVTTTEELDAARRAGFYRYAISNSLICGISFSSASMIVYSNTSNSCVQELRPHKMNYCLRRNYVGGTNPTWSDWELVGGVRKLLWENASLSSTFDAQKISLDLSGYDGVEVVTYADETTDVYLNSGFIRKGLQGVFQYMYATQSYRLTRTFTVSDTGVDFATATNTGSLAVNKLAKPYLIYGVKGVSK